MVVVVHACARRRGRLHGGRGGSTAHRSLLYWHHHHHHHDFHWQRHHDDASACRYQKIFQAQLNLQAQNVSAITNQLQVQVTAQVTVINAAAAANATISA